MPGTCTIKPDCPRLDDPATADLIARYDSRVPRYTSYPTAPHFHAGIDGSTYRQWLQELDPSAPLSLYVHIPFCEQLCWYCGCHTSVAPRYRPISGFVDVLIREIELVAATSAARREVAALHFGGGTPNILSPADLSRIAKALRSNFRVHGNAEFAAECDPRTLDRAWIEEAVLLGLNRVSLGVQDLDPVVQGAINRVQPWATTRRAIDNLRNLGVDAINIDLMYGLPHQTAAGIRRTVETVVSMQPDRIALFGYAHVPWMKPSQALIAEHTLPSPVERFRQQAAAAACLGEHGYVRVGIDHFALPRDALARGAIRRNFQGYTTDEAESLIGFGASAIGRLGRGYVQNELKVKNWRAAIEQGRLPVARGIALTRDDRFRGDLIERLMCEFSVDLDEVASLHERTVSELAGELLRLEGYVADGLVTMHGRRIEITDRGRPFARAVCAVFDRYLSRSAGRHSPAV